MKRIRVDFLIALPALAVIAFYLAGGVGVFVVGLVSFAWRLAPFRTQEPFPDFRESGGFGSSWAQDTLRKSGNLLPVIPPRRNPLLVLFDVLLSLVVFLAGLAMAFGQLTGRT